MTPPQHPLKLQVGGQLNPRKHLFVSRQDIEDELYDNLARCEYCNVLSSRQVGKSSVMMKTALRLQENGIRVVTIDMAGELGTPKTAAAWYQGFLTKVIRDLKLDVDVGDWWNSHAGMTDNQRLMEFFRTQLFAGDGGPVVIFVDEIDSTLKLPYADDFFTAIRTMYNQRAAEPAYENVAFCLIGVASPNELVKDRRTTSYNVGHTIEFRDFDSARDDLNGLVSALADDVSVGEELLHAVLDWTSGHPYLTLWFCQEIHNRQLTSAAAVNALAEEAFAGINQVDSDVHFQQITRYLGERVTDQLAALRLYDSILQGNTEPDKAAPIHIELKLSGIVRRDEQGNLAVRNRIYENIFNRQWVRQSAPRQTLRQLRRFAVAATILLLVGSGWYGYDRLVLEPPRKSRIIAAGQVAGLLVAEINEVPDLIDAMRPNREWTDPLLKEELEKLELSPSLLKKLEERDPSFYRRHQNKRLRASLALLETDPQQVDYLWKQLLTNTTTEEEKVISEILAKDAPEDMKSLTARIVTANDEEFNSLFLKLEQRSDEMGSLLKNAIEIVGPAISTSTAAGSLVLHSRRANALIAQLRMDDSNLVVSLLETSSEPTTRSYFIDRVARLGVNPDLIRQLLETETVPSVRQALIMSLAEFDEKRFPINARKEFIPTLVNFYTDDPDPGVHAASEWLLRRWQREKRLADEDRQQWETAMQRLATGKLEGERQWYVTSKNGHTMAALPKGKYWYGEPSEDGGLPEKRELDHGFAISTTEVTVQQFRTFLEGKEDVHDKDVSLDNDNPVSTLTWFMAAEYCNWLSEQEGLSKDQWCYEPNEKSEYGEGMKIIPQRNGYRLPTEEEWEYACRAGTSTPYCFGDEVELLRNYANYSSSSFGDARSTTLPVASLKPNDFGLFDMHGNVWEWCQNRYEVSEVADADSPKTENVSEPDGRVLRGGSFFNVAHHVRSAYRNFNDPASRISSNGFRVARTYN